MILSNTCAAQVSVCLHEPGPMKRGEYRVSKSRSEWKHVIFLIISPYLVKVRKVMLKKRSFFWLMDGLEVSLWSSLWLDGTVARSDCLAKTTNCIITCILWPVAGQSSPKHCCIFHLHAFCLYPLWANMQKSEHDIYTALGL